MHIVNIRIYRISIYNWCGCLGISWSTDAYHRVICLRGSKIRIFELRIYLKRPLDISITCHGIRVKYVNTILHIWITIHLNIIRLRQNLWLINALLIYIIVSRRIHLAVVDVIVFTNPLISFKKYLLEILLIN